MNSNKIYKKNIYKKLMTSFQYKNWKYNFFVFIAINSFRAFSLTVFLLYIFIYLKIEVFLLSIFNDFIFYFIFSLHRLNTRLYLGIFVVFKMQYRRNCSSSRGSRKITSYFSYTNKLKENGDSVQPNKPNGWWVRQQDGKQRF